MCIHDEREASEVRVHEEDTDHDDLEYESEL